jgi:hypothetical protein
MAIYLSGPTIAAIRHTARMTENVHIRSGHYGAPIWHEGVAFVSAELVGRRNGQRLTPEQIAHAAAGKPHRILILNQSHTEAA